MGSCYVALAGLELLASSDPPASASQSAEIIGVSHCTWPSIVFNCFVEKAAHYVTQAALKLLGSGDRPTLASQNDGITGTNHST